MESCKLHRCYRAVSHVHVIRKITSWYTETSLEHYDAPTTGLGEPTGDKAMPIRLLCEAESCDFRCLFLDR